MFNLTAEETKKVKENVSRVKYLNKEYFKEVMNLSDTEAAEQLRKVKNCMLAAEILFLYIDNEDEEFNELLFEKIGNL
jgi:hypothetical protein